MIYYVPGWHTHVKQIFKGKNLNHVTMFAVDGYGVTWHQWCVSIFHAFLSFSGGVVSSFVMNWFILSNKGAPAYQHYRNRGIRFVIIVTRLGITVTTIATTVKSDRGVSNAFNQVGKALGSERYQATVKLAHSADKCFSLVNRLYCSHAVTCYPFVVAHNWT